MRKKFLLLYAFLILSTQAQANLSSDPPWWPEEPPVVSKEFSALAKLLGCSGVLIDVGGPSTAPAYVITNGHCVGFPGPGEFWINKYSYEEISFVSSLTGKKVNFITRNIDYATMTGSDLALIKLNDESIASMQSKGVFAMKLAKRSPLRDEIVMRADIKSGLQKYTCAIEAIAEHLQEGQWHFKGSFRHNCESTGGTSGSPIISVATGEIIAIHNTSVNKTSACSVSSACELDQQGKVSLFFGKKYAQRTEDLATCFDASGTFDLNLAECTLQKGL